MSATATIATEQNKTGIITLEALADLLTNSVILEKIDLGMALVYKVKHALIGDIVLVNTCGDDNAVVYM